MFRSRGENTGVTLKPLLDRRATLYVVPLIATARCRSRVLRVRAPSGPLHPLENIMEYRELFRVLDAAVDDRDCIEIIVDGNVVYTGPIEYYKYDLLYEKLYLGNEDESEGFELELKRTDNVEIRTVD